jgi:hypothetical protein
MIELMLTHGLRSFQVMMDMQQGRLHAEDSSMRRNYVKTLSGEQSHKLMIVGN